VCSLFLTLFASLFIWFGHSVVCHAPMTIVLATRRQRVSWLHLSNA
jgi:hypothetical protein